MESFSSMRHDVMCPHASNLCMARCETHHCRWPSLIFARLNQSGGMSKVVGSYSACLHSQCCERSFRMAMLAGTSNKVLATYPGRRPAASLIFSGSVNGKRSAALASYRSAPMTGNAASAQQKCQHTHAASCRLK